MLIAANCAIFGSANSVEILKKVLGYILLIIFLFNAGGYLLLFKYLIFRSDERMANTIQHHNYNRTELVQVKVPMHLPNVVNWDNYEQINGEMQLKGHYYKYVGLKITRDTMFLLCLPDDEKTRLENEHIQLAKQENDSPTSKRAHGALPKLAPPIAKYDYQVIELHFPAPVTILQKFLVHNTASWEHPPLSVDGQPPELMV